MELIVRPRQMGKTTELIERMKADPDSICIFSDWQAARRAWNLSGMDISQRWRFRSYYEYTAHNINQSLYRNHRVYIDNVDQLLHNLFGNVIMATMTDASPQVSDPLDGPESIGDASDGPTRTDYPPIT